MRILPPLLQAKKKLSIRSSTLAAVGPVRLEVGAINNLVQGLGPAPGGAMRWLRPTEVEAEVSDIFKALAACGSSIDVPNILGRLQRVLSACEQPRIGRRVSHVCFVKVLQLLKQLLLRPLQPAHSATASDLLEFWLKGIGPRLTPDWGMEAKSVMLAMFQLGCLVNDERVGRRCGEEISDVLCPHLIEQMQGYEEVDDGVLALAFTSCVRASERQLGKACSPSAGPSCADKMIAALLHYCARREGCIRQWDSGALTLACKYGVQHLERISRTDGEPHATGEAAAEIAALELMLTVWLEEAKCSERGLVAGLTAPRHPTSSGDGVRLERARLNLSYAQYRFARWQEHRRVLLRNARARSRPEQGRVAKALGSLSTPR